MHRRTIKSLAPVVCLVAALTLALGACAQKKVYGGDRTFKTAPPTESTKAKASTPPASKPPASQAPKTSQPTRATQTKTTEKIVKILGGQCGIGPCGFEPQAFYIYKGTIVVIKNEDVRDRSWVSDTVGVFDSGPIKPGGEYRYKADKVGAFSFHDEHVPSALGRMDVCGSSGCGG